MWSGIRDLGIVFTKLREDPEIQGQLQLAGENINIVLNVLFVIVIAYSILIHIYIGRKAMQFSLGKSKGKAYVVLAAVLVLLSFITYVNDFRNHQLFASYEIDQAVLLVIDLTSNLILGEVVVCSILLRRWRDKGCR